MRSRAPHSGRQVAPEPMELDDEAPPLGSQWDKAAGRTATATETVVLPLGPPPHALGGMVTQAIAAARRDELGLVERAPALEREERVAVGSSVAWAKMTDVEELRDRGRAEATERKALAKRADTLERNQMTLEGQVKQLRAERDALRVDKAAAEKRERERAKAERAAGKKGALPIEVFDAARKICTENGLQCAARPVNYPAHCLVCGASVRRGFDWGLDGWADWGRGVLACG